MKRASVGPSKIEGWGLIASEPVEAGATVDESPIVVFSGRLPAEVNGHAYELPDGRRALPCGDGVFANHARPANTEPRPDLRRQVMRLVAVTDIAPGDEVTIDYGEDW